MPTKSEIRKKTEAAAAQAVAAIPISVLRSLGKDVTLGEMLDAADEDTAELLRGISCHAMSEALTLAAKKQIPLYAKKRRRTKPTAPARPPEPEVTAQTELPTQPSAPANEAPGKGKGNGRDKSPPRPEDLLDDKIEQVILASDEPLGSKLIRDGLKEKFSLECTDGEFRGAIKRLKDKNRIAQSGKLRGVTYGRPT